MMDATVGRAECPASDASRISDRGEVCDGHDCSPIITERRQPAASGTSSEAPRKALASDRGFGAGEAIPKKMVQAKGVRARPYSDLRVDKQAGRLRKAQRTVLAGCKEIRARERGVRSCDGAAQEA